MKFLKLLTLLFIPSFLIAQGPVYEKIQDAKASNSATEFELVNTVGSDLRSINVPADELSEGLILDLDYAEISDLKTLDAELIKLSFPLPDQSNIVVELVQNKVLAEDFVYRKSSVAKGLSYYSPGKYYHGVIENDPNSLVAISVFDDEIVGLINTSRGNYIIGKLQGNANNQHIIYNDLDLATSFDLGCETEDDGYVYSRDEITFQPGPRDPGDCIRVYIEIDDDIVSNKGGATPATNYITGLFNEVITLYANDGLDMTISEILAWDTPAPYSGGSSSAMLSSYQSNTGAFNGDLSHLVSYQASGGIAAGFSGICASNPDNSKCFSSIDATYSVVPTYSWSVMVCTHEMGHLIGSRHTHACVWNGNGTAIDGCSGSTEGSCPLPGIPPEGGTLMSYCHLQPEGINFNLGFGPQPTAVLLNTVENATCLSTCGTPGPTCNDGIQNGEETGIDCGGPNCDPCCETNEITITIILDNYPEETSWDIQDDNNNVVASGGTYGYLPDGSTVTVDVCLNDGCYDFTIYDSYGDGICCGYGNGSYEVTDANNNVLASGGQFGSSETTNFCLNSGGPILGCTDPNAHNYDPNATQDDGSCETCTDNIQNGDETGVDCGGVLCDPCSSGNLLIGSYFESGWDGWLDGGSDCFRYSGPRSWEGSYSIRIRDNSGTSSAMTTAASYDVSSYSQIEITFYFYPSSMESGEDFWIRYYDGSGWITVAQYVSGTSFNNNSFYTSTVTLNSSTYNFPTDARFRFQCDASANNDRIYIDEVTITASSGSLVEEGTIVTIEELGPVYEYAGLGLVESSAEKTVSLFPNPATNMLNINASKQIESIKVLSSFGQFIKTYEIEDYSDDIDISNLKPGVYYVLIQMDGEVVTQKFVKL